jgi:hypothetical protein
LNPYASHLGDRDPREVIGSTAGHLSALIAGMDAQTCNHKPSPEKWSIREVLCHLADTELVFAFRIRQSLAESHHVIQPFDQDLWALNYNAYDVQQALRLFASVREWNLTLVNALPPESMNRPLSHPERGEMTFQTLIETMAGHDLNHLKQIKKILGT